MSKALTTWLGVAGLLVVACSPTDLCGCSDPLGQAIIRGTVRTETGTPVSGAIIESRRLPADCSDLPDHPPQPSDVSRADGSYEVNVPALYGVAPQEVCAEISAIRTAGDAVDTVVVQEVVETAAPTPPPVSVDIVFPG